MIDRVLVALAGFTLGILAASLVPLGYSMAGFALLLGVLLFLAVQGNLLGWHMLPLSLVLVMVSLGVARFHFSELVGTLDHVVGTRVSLEARIVSDSDVRETTQQFVVEADAARILVVTERYPFYRYGDRLRLAGDLMQPKDFETQNGRTFDYDAYLAKDGIEYQLFRPSIEILARGEGNPVYEMLFSVKRTFLDRLSLLIPEPALGLASGELLGVKQALGKTLLAAFVATSVVHVVVLSGYNISLVVKMIMALCARLPRKAMLVIAGGTIVFFVLMTGAEAPAVRAATMALILLFAQGVGRVGDATRLLIIAGALMLLHNPQLLVFDPAFQLSFIATLGLIHITPRLMPLFRWIRSQWLRDIVASTIAAQVAVLPLLLYLTGTFSLVALPANVLVLIAVPGAMLLSFITGVLGFISITLATPVGWLATLFLQYQIVVVEFFAAMATAALSLPVFSAWIVVAVYVVAAVVIMRTNKNLSVSPT